MYRLCNRFHAPMHAKGIIYYPISKVYNVVALILPPHCD